MGFPLIAYARTGSVKMPVHSKGDQSELAALVSICIFNHIVGYCR